MAVKKQEFDFINKYCSVTKYKEDDYYYCGDSFTNACGLPGPIMGSINMFLGHSDSGKTNALITTAVDVIKKGHLPVFIITEKKWKWEHAVQLGLPATKNENGQWSGTFIYNDTFDYIEQATDFINKLIDEQEKGKIPMSMCFLWDSIGSIPCKLTFEGGGGKEHNASVLADKIGLGIHNRIGSSKKEDYPYINTLVVVNQPWVEKPENKFSRPKIKAKGGNALWLASALVFLFGNQKNAGISFIPATRGGRKVIFATRTKISILKNHVNGVAYQDGKIIATPHGFINDTKEDIEKYKKEYAKYWGDILGGSGEIELGEDVQEIEMDDEV